MQSNDETSLALRDDQKIALHELKVSATFEPQSFSELMTFADTMARSDLLPDHFKAKPANIVSAIIAGREVGLSAYQSLQSIAVIKGRATLWGDAVLGLVRAQPKICEYVKEWSEGEGELEVAYCEAKRRDQADPVRIAFSVKDAAMAGLWMKRGKDGQDTPWTNYPSRMLKMRARSWCLRDTFPDILRGMAVAEEVADYPEPARILGAQGTRAEQVLAALQDQVEEGEIKERPLPDVSRMLKEQISDTIAQEAQMVGMPSEVAREIVKEASTTKKPVREKALDAIRAIRAWKPEPVEAPSDAEAATE